jgi:hypothetical protein
MPNTATATVTKLEPKPLVNKIHPKHMIQTEYAYARISVTLPVGWTFEDTLIPEFWSQVAHIFHAQPVTNEPDKAGATLEIRTEDHAFYAELYVRAVHERGLTVAVIREPVYFGPKSVDTAQYKTRWNVGARGHDVIRVTDGAIVSPAKDNKTKEEAMKWIDDTVASMRI